MNNDSDWEDVQPEAQDTGWEDVESTTLDLDKIHSRFKTGIKDPAEAKTISSLYLNHILQRDPFANDYESAAKSFFGEPIEASSFAKLMKHQLDTLDKPDDYDEFQLKTPDDQYKAIANSLKPKDPTWAEYGGDVLDQMVNRWSRTGREQTYDDLSPEDQQKTKAAYIANLKRQSPKFRLALYTQQITGEGQRFALHTVLTKKFNQLRFDKLPAADRRSMLDYLDILNQPEDYTTGNGITELTADWTKEAGQRLKRAAGRSADAFEATYDVMTDGMRSPSEPRMAYHVLKRHYGNDWRETFEDGKLPDGKRHEVRRLFLAAEMAAQTRQTSAAYASGPGLVAPSFPTPKVDYLDKVYELAEQGEQEFNSMKTDRQFKQVLQQKFTDGGLLRQGSLGAVEMSLDLGAVMAASAIGTPAAGAAYTAGRFYGDFAETLIYDHDVDPHDASMIAGLASIPYAAIEYSQVSKMKPIAKRFTQEWTKNIGRHLIGVMKARGIDTVTEIGEEGLQATIEAAGKAYAKEFADANGIGYEQLMKDIGNDIVQAAITMPFIMAPGGAIEAGRGSWTGYQASKLVKGAPMKATQVQRLVKRATKMGYTLDVELDETVTKGFTDDLKDKWRTAEGHEDRKAILQEEGYTTDYSYLGSQLDKQIELEDTAQEIAAEETIDVETKVDEAEAELGDAYIEPEEHLAAEPATTDPAPAAAETQQQPTPKKVNIKDQPGGRKDLRRYLKSNPDATTKVVTDTASDIDNLILNSKYADRELLDAANDITQEKTVNPIKKRAEIAKESPMAEIADQLKKAKVSPEYRRDPSGTIITDKFKRKAIPEEYKEFYSAFKNTRGDDTAPSADQLVQEIAIGNDAAAVMAKQMMETGAHPVEILTAMMNSHNEFIDGKMDEAMTVSNELTRLRDQIQDELGIKESLQRPTMRHKYQFEIRNLLEQGIDAESNTDNKNYIESLPVQPIQASDLEYGDQVFYNNDWHEVIQINENSGIITLNNGAIIDVAPHAILNVAGGAIVDEFGNIQQDKPQAAPAADPDAIPFSQAADQTGVPLAALQAHIAQLGFAARVTGLQSPTDAPQHLQDEATKRGIVFDGVTDPTQPHAYVIADNIPSLARAEQVIMHEAKVHVGLRILFTPDQLNLLLDNLITAVPELDGMTFEQAEEHLAGIAEQGAAPGTIGKIIASIRDWLREMGFISDWTDNDILALIDKGRAAAMTGDSETLAGPAARFSQPAYPMAPEGEWWGEGTYQEMGGKLIDMTPDEFLAKSKPLEMDDITRENIDDLKQHIEAGHDLDPLTLYKDDPTDVKASDGRHRAIAAKELGIPIVPVVDYTNQATPDIRFSSENDLIALHNLTDENLLFADTLGGIPVPSLGITKAQTPFTQFGGITLIGDKNMVDPKTGVPVFDSDAYTSRFPDLVWPKVPMKKADKFYYSVKDIFLEADDSGSLTQIFDSMVNYPDKTKAIRELKYSNGGMLTFLREKKIPLEIPTRSVTLRVGKWVTIPEFQATFTRLFKTIESTPSADHAKLPEYKELTTAAVAAVEQLYKDRSPRIVEAVKETILTDDGLLAFSTYDLIATDIKNQDKTTLDRHALSTLLQTEIAQHTDEFETWTQAQIAPLFNDPKIEIGRRKVPVTLDNIVKAMTKKATAGAEKTMTYGNGKTRAMLSKRYKSIQNIQEDRDRIIATADERKHHEANEQILENYRLAAIEKYTVTNWRGDIDTWDGLDDSMKSLAQIGTSSTTAANIIRILKKNEFDVTTADTEIIALAKQAISALKDSPTDYLEAKPQRAVSLNEFTGAVIPKSTPAAIRAILEKNDIPIAEYDPADQQSRPQAINQFSAELHTANPGIRFSTAATMLSPTITIDGKQRPTTNSEGQQIVQTEAEIRNFYEWFGSSEVVDDQGRPKVVYHGSVAGGVRPDGSPVSDKLPFNEFKLQNSVGSWLSGLGPAWFTDSKEQARKIGGPNVFETYLRMESVVEEVADRSAQQSMQDKAKRVAELSEMKKINSKLHPNHNEYVYLKGQLDIEKGLEWVDPGNALNAMAEAVATNKNISDGDRKGNALRQLLVDNDYDGITLHDTLFDQDRASGTPQTWYIPFDPTQIKSATDNNGDFDGSNPDIRYSNQQRQPRKSKDILAERAKNPPQPYRQDMDNPADNAAAVLAFNIAKGKEYSPNDARMFLTKYNLADSAEYILEMANQLAAGIKTDMDILQSNYLIKKAIRRARLTPYFKKIAFESYKTATARGEHIQKAKQVLKDRHKATLLRRTGLNVQTLRDKYGVNAIATMEADITPEAIDAIITDTREAVRQALVDEGTIGPRKQLLDTVPEYRRELQMTYYHILNMGIARMQWGPRRERLLKKLNKFMDRSTRGGIENAARELLAGIEVQKVKETATDLMDQIEKLLNKRSIYAPSSKQLVGWKEDNISFDKTAWLHFVNRVRQMSGTKVEEMTDLLTTAAARPEVTVGRNYLEKAIETAEKLAIIQKFANLNQKTPGDLKEALELIMQKINAGEAEHTELYNTITKEAKARAKTIRNAIGEGETSRAAQEDTTLKSKAKSYIRNHLSLMPWFRDLTGHTDGEVRTEVDAILKDMYDDMARAYLKERTATKAFAEDFNNFLTNLYGKAADKVILELSTPNPDYAIHSNDTKTPLSKDQLYQLYLTGKQTAYTTNVDPGRVRAIAQQLDDNDHKVMDYLKKWYKDNRGDLNAVSIRLTGRPIEEPDANYAPAAFNIDRDGLNAHIKIFSPVPPFLTPRVNHDRPPNDDIGAVELWANRMQQTTRYIHVAEVGIQYMLTFGDANLKDTIKKRFGANYQNQFIEMITDVVNGSAPNINKDYKILDHARTAFTLTRLAGSPASMVRQATSIPAFLFEIPPAEFIGHLTSAATPEGVAAMITIAKSDLARERLGTFNQDVMDALSAGLHKPSLIKKLFNKMMLLPGIGDLFPTLWIGQGIYRAQMDRYIQEDMAPAAASAKALEDVFILANLTQQSSLFLNQPEFRRRGGSVGKFMGMFQSAVGQMLMHDINAVSNLKKNWKSKENWKRFGMVTALNHFVLPGLYNLGGILVNWALGEAPDEDDWQRMWISMALGPSSAYIVAGSIITSSVETAVTNKRPFGKALSPGAGLIDTGSNAVLLFRHLLTADWDDVERDMDKILIDLLPPYRYGKKGYKNRIEK